MHHVVVHAHCYQPPREDPWLEVVEAEASAAPEHDWNARINRECYERLGACEARERDPARTQDPDARAGLARLINLYAWCTFDVGATLCEWLEAEAPLTLRAMMEGDAASVRRWVHRNAIAAPYHHVILPLASPRERRTEVRWGIADFEKRFGRAPEGMWLPECAADDDTLDLLAAEGIRFTILAPYQVQTGAETHGLPVRWHGASGRSLTILPYDGALAGEVAFGGLLRDPTALARRLAPSIPDGQPRCTTLATDGETFGHHHRNGDRTLALAMSAIAARKDAQLTNAAAITARYPATLSARLVSPSAWSCAHGVERWRSNCGCRLDHQRPPAQHWRGPLREALEQLAERSYEQFARDALTVFAEDPWTVRDAYGAVVASDGEPLAHFVSARVRRDEGDGSVSTRQAVDRRIAEGRVLLEMQRATLRMFTSCAWFFDDVERIETRQVLRYAARVLELSGNAAQLEPAFVASLATARAPHTPAATEYFLRDTSLPADSLWRAAAGAMALAASQLAETRIGAYDIEVVTAVPPALAHRVLLRHRRTGAQDVFLGTTSGSGPALTVTLREASDFDERVRDFALRDLPESVAYAILRETVNEDSALLA